MKPRTWKRSFWLFVLCSVSMSVKAQDIHVSHDCGWYANPFYLKVSSPYQVRYTTNGDTPGLSSQVFHDSVLIEGNDAEAVLSLIPTTAIEYNNQDWRNREFGWRAPEEIPQKMVVIRMAGFSHNSRMTEEMTMVFRIGKRLSDFPQVSITTDSLNLFDEDFSIMVPWFYYDPSNPYWSGNYYMKGDIWERPGHLHFFEKDGSLAIDQQIGMRIHGGSSRVCPQKSLRIYARGDKKSFNYPVFPDQPIIDYRRLLLRSSMTYWYGRNAIFQDEYLQRLIQDFYPDMDLQASRPAELFINGEYWGLIKIRERLDEYYLGAHYQVPEDDVKVISPTTTQNTDFSELLTYCMNNDLSQLPAYAWVADRMDIDNFIQYVLIELYYGNADWPHNNSKAWKKLTEGGRWRWLLYDLDASLKRADQDLIDKFLESDAPVPVIFRALMENYQFMEKLGNEWQRMKTELFIPSVMGTELSSMVDAYQPGIERHANRWGNPADTEAWMNSVNEIYAVLLDRTEEFDLMLSKHFTRIVPGDHPQISWSDNWLVYPNPVSDYINIESKEPLQMAWNIVLINSLGQVIWQQEMMDRAIRQDMSHLPSGVYFLRIQSNVYDTTVRLVK